MSAGEPGVWRKYASILQLADFRWYLWVPKLYEIGHLHTISSRHEPPAMDAMAPRTRDRRLHYNGVLQEYSKSKLWNLAISLLRSLPSQKVRPDKAQLVVSKCVKEICNYPPEHCCILSNTHISSSISLEFCVVQMLGLVVVDSLDKHWITSRAKFWRSLGRWSAGQL